MRILFGSWPGYGHLLPMVPLIRAAQHGGHDVVVSSGADMSALIGRLGVTTHQSGVTLAESYERMPDHATISELPAEQQPVFAARHLFDAGAVDRAHDVVDRLQRWRPGYRGGGPTSSCMTPWNWGRRPPLSCTGSRTSPMAMARWCPTPAPSRRSSCSVSWRYAGGWLADRRPRLATRPTATSHGPSATGAGAAGERHPSAAHGRPARVVR
jgi:hypothetical protein